MWKKNNCRLISLLGLLAILSTSCGEYEVLELQKKAQRSADSLYRVHLDSLKKSADSICNAHYQLHYDRFYDSLRTVQLSQYEELVKK